MVASFRALIQHRIVLILTDRQSTIAVMLRPFWLILRLTVLRVEHVLHSTHFLLHLALLAPQLLQLKTESHQVLLISTLSTVLCFFDISWCSLPLCSDSLSLAAFTICIWPFIHFKIAFGIHFSNSHWDWSKLLPTQRRYKISTFYRFTQSFRLIDGVLHFIALVTSLNSKITLQHFPYWW